MTSPAVFLFDCPELRALHARRVPVVVGRDFLGKPQIMNVYPEELGGFEYVVRHVGPGGCFDVHSRIEAGQVVPRELKVTPFIPAYAPRWWRSHV